MHEHANGAEPASSAQSTMAASSGTETTFRLIDSLTADRAHPKTPMELVAATASLAVGLAAACLPGCAVQRAVVANDAQEKMVGLTKEQLLACMGPPATKAAEGVTEVWSYNSGNDRTTVNTFGHSTTNVSVSGGSGYATGRASTLSSGIGIASRRYCNVSVVMADGRVNRVNYAGPTGGLLTGGEQCAFAVQNCSQMVAR
jgi:hypothetical protein